MKTPKRISSRPSVIDVLDQRHSRWKRKNRVKQLKNTIRTINNKLADANLSRIILRDYLINNRNAYIIRSRKAETEQARKDWLAATRDLSLFINLSHTPAELYAELNGKDPIPHAIKFTAEECAILTSLREETLYSNVTEPAACASTLTETAAQNTEG